MKLKFIKIHHENGGFNSYEEIRDQIYCCSEMKEAIKDKFIKIDYPYIQITKPSWEGSTDKLEIKFCPFCSEKIEVEVFREFKEIEEEKEEVIKRTIFKRIKI
jgi:hypothetical protein